VGHRAVLDANPLGKVPCLVMEGGEAVFDSRVIVEYLDTLSPVGKLIPPSGRERTEVRTWEALADGVLDASHRRPAGTDLGRPQRRTALPGLGRPPDVAVHAALKAMGQGLGDKPWCAGIHFTLADVAVGCALGYLDFRFAQIDWRAEHPNLKKLHDKLVLRPSFVDTAPRV
jgi:glutathione S-transferase